MAQELLDVSAVFLMQARVIAVLDWELSTLGNQMSDAAYNCLVHYPTFTYTVSSTC